VLDGTVLIAKGSVRVVGLDVVPRLHVTLVIPEPENSVECWIRTALKGVCAAMVDNENC